MDDSLVIGLGLLAILLVFGFMFYIAGRSDQKKKCRYHAMSEMSEQLDEAVDTILRLEEKLALIKSMENERACKEDLMQTVHQLFFFREFKNPEEVHKTLEDKMEHAAGATCFTEESRAVAEMYRKILDDIRPSWLEGKKP